MKIKSKTDVITNSSTEAFTYVTEDSLGKIKELIDDIIQVSEGKGTCDSYFDLKLGYVDKDLVREYWEWENERDDGEEPSEEELYEYALNYMKEHTLKNYEGAPEFDHVEVIAKDPANEDLAVKITNILRSFTKSDTFLC